MSLVSYSSLDPSLSSISSLSGSIENLGGPFGAYLSDALFSVAGIGAYLFLLVLSFVAVKQLFFYQPSDKTHKVIKFT
ncbi:DNA translocase FtsK 4TM domain-containing protein, partial [Gammaproteobacteria bacterium]|nr:DNA translocase FtsK 4TM domain-containing protein [Gammaproteobacteria bacterium]